MNPNSARRAALLTAAAWACALGTLAASAPARAQQGAQGQTVKVAWIDPLSGMMATVGTNWLKAYQLTAEAFNKQNASGVKFEIVPFDSKLSPQESVVALRSAIDQGIRYVMQGNGSGPALAIVEAVERHNARNPADPVVFFNHGAIDPDLTNSKCSYWHFRTDADGSMKVAALTSYIKDLPEIKKVYLINQNYSHGQQTSKFSREMLAAKRPDIEIVGDDFSPLAQVRDFAPYVAKIKASGADTVITGNWGTDLSLLIKAFQDAGLDTIKIFTYYAYVAGTPTAIAAKPGVQIYAVNTMHYHLGGAMQPLMQEFKKRGDGDFVQGSIYHTIAALDAAFAKADSTAPGKVAAALEDLRFDSAGGEVHIRKQDHQLQQGLYILKWQKAGGEYSYDVENTGYTFVPVKHVPLQEASTPSICQMKRP